jgi:hypothetical protein
MPILNAWSSVLTYSRWRGNATLSGVPALRMGISRRASKSPQEPKRAWFRDGKIAPKRNWNHSKGAIGDNTSSQALTPSKSCQLTLANWQSKRLLLDNLANVAAANALYANSQSLVLSAWKFDFHSLQVRAELTASDAGDLGTNTAQVLRFTANFNAITKRCGFRADITLTGHQSAPTASKNASFSYYFLSGYDRVTRLSLKTYILLPVSGRLNRSEEYTRFAVSHNAKH